MIPMKSKIVGDDTAVTELTVVRDRVKEVMVELEENLEGNQEEMRRNRKGCQPQGLLDGRSR